MMSTLSPQAVESLKARLHAFYADGSKHAVYQNVPEFVRDALGYHEAIDETWRSDTPRYNYLNTHLKLADGARIADVGANTGYFALNFARARPGCRVNVFEPNANHHAFIQEISRVFQLVNITIASDSWTIGNLGRHGHFDAVFLLNILHHAGFDFDPQVSDNNESFTAYAVDYLRQLRKVTRQLCFQIGSNRGGDKRRPLFAYDDDSTRLTWTCQLLKHSGWLVRHAGIAERMSTAQIGYKDLPIALLTAVCDGQADTSILSDYFSRANLAQFPGEFYRRPLFICEAV